MRSELKVTTKSKVKVESELVKFRDTLQRVIKDFERLQTEKSQEKIVADYTEKIKLLEMEIQKERDGKNFKIKELQLKEGIIE